MKYRSIEKDLLIISYLRRNARENLTTISKLTRIPVSTIFDKLKFTKGKLIKKFTTIIDFQSLGFFARVLLIIKVKKEERGAIKDYVIQHKNVNSAFKVNNNFDILIEAIFKNIGEYESFLEELESKFNIEQRKEFFIIEDLKREEFLSSPEFLEMIDFEL